MSPRAACRLEQLGFPEVYDYTAGKADWLAHGLETEGEQAGVLRARHAVRADVVTASIEEPVGEVRARVAASPYGFALVVAADGTVVGRLRAAPRSGRAHPQRRRPDPLRARRRAERARWRPTGCGAGLPHGSTPAAAGGCGRRPSSAGRGRVAGLGSPNPSATAVRAR